MASGCSCTGVPTLRDYGLQPLVNRLFASNLGAGGRGDTPEARIEMTGARGVHDLRRGCNHAWGGAPTDGPETGPEEDVGAG